MSLPLSFTAACPACGSDARWQAQVVLIDNRKERLRHDIVCPVCDPPGSVPKPFSWLDWVRGTAA